MNRNKLVDALKGYACLLVVFGHVIIGIRTSGEAVPSFMQTAERFIWTFHIDLFMFLSGFVYSLTGGWKRKGSRGGFILNKLLSLGIPYLIFSCLYITVNSLAPGVNNQAAFSDMLFLWKTPVAQYWFLFALFWLFVIWAIIPSVVPNYAKTAFFYALFIVLKVLRVDMGIFDSSLNCVLAFGLGTCLTALPVEKIPRPVRIAVLPTHIAATVALIKFGLIDKLFVDDFATVFGIFASVCFIFEISRLSPVRRFLEFICKYSFQIYLLHTFFTAAIRILLIKFGVGSYIVHVAAGSVVGVLFPVLIAKIASLSPYINGVFFPTKLISEIRKKRSRKESQA